MVEFNEWYSTAGVVHCEDSREGASAAWDHQQQKINKLEEQLKTMRKANKDLLCREIRNNAARNALREGLGMVLELQYRLPLAVARHLAALLRLEGEENE